MYCRSDQVTGLTIIPGECGHAVVTVWRKLRQSLSLSIKFFLDCEKLNIDGLNSKQRWTPVAHVSASDLQLRVY